MLTVKSILIAITAAFVASAAPSSILDAADAIAFHEYHNDGGRVALKDDAPNGRYMTHNDTHAAYFGPGEAINATAVRERKRDFFGNCAVTCNGQQAQANMITVAEMGIEKWFGSGLSWSKQIYYYNNPIYAFACDYGKRGQYNTADDYDQETQCVDAECTQSGGGWNSHFNTWHAQYGREFNSFSC